MWQSSYIWEQACQIIITFMKLKKKPEIQGTLSIIQFGIFLT